jgi:crotonobetainyl-CoA:carnitine CoA-transferase CaiB-like acyl-CoA transferase
MTDENRPPLDGVKVLDLSRWIAGPMCTMLLADMGADVIKVERPGGEDVRALQPRVGDESAYALHYHRNKRAVTVNTRDADGIAVLRRLVEWADVLVENYRPGTLEAMGLGFDELQRINPRVIVTSVSGFGQHGPWRHRPLFNTIAEAMSGSMSLTGSPETGPTMSGTFVADHTAGLYAAFATMVALHSRTHTGRGQHADVSLFDAMFSVLGYPVTAALNGVEVSPPAGNRDSTAAPGNIFATADDRHIYLDAGTQGLFEALSEAMGGSGELGDPRFRTGDDRLANVEQLEKLIENWTRSMTLGEVCDALDAAGVPHGPVNTVAEAVQSSHIAAREMTVTVRSSTGGEVRLPGVTVKLSDTPGRVRTAPPGVGQHTVEVLEDICGLGADKIRELRAKGAI